MTTKHHQGNTYTYFHDRGQKGAVQMSLGMIVAVVFAVVLLVFLVQWITSLMGSVTYLTETITEQARQELAQKLQQGIEKVGLTIPNVVTQNKNVLGKFEIGIKNNEYEPKCFAIQLKLLDADYAILAARCGTGSDYPCQALLDETKTWFTYGNYEWINQQVIKYIVATAQLSGGTIPGVYLFKLSVYTTDDTLANCDVTSIDSPTVELYETKQFAIQVED